MKNIFTTLIIGLSFASCTSVKNIYTDSNISDKQLDKLVKNYLKEPADTSNSNKLLYAYNFILQDHFALINSLKQQNTLAAKEQLISAYNGLQAYYNEAAAIPQVSQLVRPGNVQAEKQAAIKDAAAAWYNYADQLLDANNWQAGREAYNIFAKVNNWIPNYQASQSLMQEAREMGTIDAIIAPMRSEGFYQPAGYYMNNRQDFVNQLLSDLGNTWNSNDRYRVYPATPEFEQVKADWMIEPVLTRMTVSDVQYNRSTRTVTKKIEIGKDSLKNPIYKEIKAVLSITEATVCADGEIETRISDLTTQEKLARRRFAESYTIGETYASFKGDKDALSKADLAMVNNKNRLQVDEHWMREKVLEKIYPNMLSYLKNQMR